VFVVVVVKVQGVESRRGKGQENSFCGKDFVVVVVKKELQKGTFFLF
jgi:hypothetical protein